MLSWWKSWMFASCEVILLSLCTTEIEIMSPYKQKFPSKLRNNRKELDKSFFGWFQSTTLSKDKHLGHYTKLIFSLLYRLQCSLLSTQIVVKNTPHLHILQHMKKSEHQFYLHCNDSALAVDIIGPKTRGGCSLFHRVNLTSLPDIF